MTYGISVPDQYVDRFMKELEKQGINYSVWNASDLMNDTGADIDFNFEFSEDRDRARNILRSFSR